MKAVSTFAVPNKRLQFGLILTIFLVHVWVFYGFDKVEIPKHNTLNYMEVWNVTTPQTRPKPIDVPPIPSAGARARLLAPVARMAAQQAVQALPSERMQGLPRDDAAPVATASVPAQGAGEPHDPLDYHPVTGAKSPSEPLDVDRLRMLARNDERQRVKFPLERVREKERINSSIEARLGKAAARAARKNCQTDYGGAGVFAIVPLLYGTLTDDGCKWK